MSRTTTRRRRLLGMILIAALVTGLGCYFWVDRPQNLAQGKTDRILAAQPTGEGKAASTQQANPAQPATQTDAPPIASLAPPDFSDDQFDEADFAVEAEPFDSPDFPDTPLGRRLASHLGAIEGTGPEAEARYQASLEKLRETPEDATELLLNAYENMPAERYLDRWKVVDTLSALQTHASLEALAQIANQPVPEELFPDAHHFSSRAEEELIRTAAIEGLEYLASRGVLEAAGELRELVSVNDPVVQETAVRAYQRSGGDPQEIKEALAEENHWMLELQELADVRAMPQVNQSDGEQSSSAAQPDPRTHDANEPAKEHSLPPEGVQDHGMSLMPQTNSTPQ